MTRVEIDGTTIGDWSAFHDRCAAVFGFPATYGRNMDAWIDCLTYVRTGDGMSRFNLGPDDPLVIEIRDSASFTRQVPEVFVALLECAAAVNRRQIEAGELPALHLLLR